jgi:hypothetical protein
MPDSGYNDACRTATGMSSSMQVANVSSATQLARVGAQMATSVPTAIPLAEHALVRRLMSAWIAGATRTVWTPTPSLVAATVTPGIQVMRARESRRSAVRDAQAAIQTGLAISALKVTTCYSKGARPVMSSQFLTMTLHLVITTTFHSVWRRESDGTTPTATVPITVPS